MLTVGLVGVTAKITSLLSPLGKVGVYFDGMAQYIKTASEAAKAHGASLKDVVRLGSKILDNTTAEEREYAQLLILDQKGLLNSQQRIRLSQLMNSDLIKEKGNIVEIVALEQSRNNLMMIRNSLITTTLSLIVGVALPKILEYIDNYNSRVSVLQGKIEDTRKRK